MSEPPTELRQADVARALGVSEGLVTQWEQGGKKPGRDLVQPLADFLGCELRWLLTGAGEMSAGAPVATPTPAPVPRGSGSPDPIVERLADRLSRAGQRGGAPRKRRAR